MDKSLLASIATTVAVTVGVALPSSAQAWPGDPPVQIAVPAPPQVYVAPSRRVYVAPDVASDGSRFTARMRARADRQVREVAQLAVVQQVLALVEPALTERPTVFHDERG